MCEKQDEIQRRLQEIVDRKTKAKLTGPVTKENIQARFNAIRDKNKAAKVAQSPVPAVEAPTAEQPTVAEPRLPVASFTLFTDGTVVLFDAKGERLCELTSEETACKITEFAQLLIE